MALRMRCRRSPVGRPEHPQSLSRGRRYGLQEARPHPAASPFGHADREETPSAGPFLRLRLGQCLFELRELEEAANWLGGAFLLEGTKIFAESDPKYLAFVKPKLSPPRSGWPEGW